MTKRDAIEAMARAMGGSAFGPFCAKTHGSPVNHQQARAMWLKKAEAGYEALAEMAKAERKAQSTPSTPAPTAEAVVH